MELIKKQKTKQKQKHKINKMKTNEIRLRKCVIVFNKGS